jgi:predicted metalloendopeptidase
LIDKRTSKEGSGPSALTQQLYKGVHIMDPLTSKHPGDDFYSYVNGRWVQKTPIPSYSSSFGVSEEVEMVIQSTLLEEVNACMELAEIGREQTTTEGRLRDAIGRLAMSAMRPRMQVHNVEYLKKGVRSLGCMRDAKDISSALGTMCRYNVQTILELSVIPEEGGGHTLSVAPGRLGLPAASYYSPTGGVGDTINVLEAYTQLVQDVSKALDMDDLSSAIPFEANLSARVYGDQGATSLSGMRLNELHRRWPAIDWTAMFSVYGIPEERLKTLTVYIDSEQWVNVLNGLVHEIPLQGWYPLLSLHTVLHALEYLPPPFDDMHYKFFGRILRGQKEKIPQRILTLNIIKQQMSIALGYLFVKRHMDQSFKARATQFTEKIVASAVRRMGEVDWFSKEARSAAAEKLRRMILSVAWSQPLVDAPPELPSLQTDTLLANLYLLEAATTDRKLRELTHHPLKDGWDEPPYSVNAYYYHDTNELVIPAGSFMWPFMDMQGRGGRGLGWNFGGLGAVIGHEITHAFDREGKDFDPAGRAKVWWSKADHRAYNRKTRTLIHLFGRAKSGGRAVNGALTLDENLADLGGLAIALDALHHELEKGRAGAEEKKKQLREFFLSYALSWRTKEQPERRLQRLLLDKHAPIELRVNLIVAQFEDWYEAFDVRTEHALYIPPEERIRIF